MIGDGYHTYSDSTMMRLKRTELIKIIRLLESNLKGADKENQFMKAQNEWLLDKMKDDEKPSVDDYMKFCKEYEEKNG